MRMRPHFSRVSYVAVLVTALGLLAAWAGLVQL
jgi:hypothetical protein